MSERAARRLRDLVNDYYHGLISADSYRERRAALLDSIGDPHAGADTTSRRDRAETVSRPEAEPAETVDSARRLGPMWIASVTVVGIGVVAFFSMRSPGDVAGDVYLAEPSPPPAELSTPAGEVLIDDFNYANDWSVDSIERLVTAWLALEDSERSAAMQGLPFREVTAKLNQRLREESALGTPATDVRLIALADLAAALESGRRSSVPTINATSAAPESPESPVPTPPDAAEAGDERNLRTRDTVEASVPDSSSPAAETVGATPTAAPPQNTARTENATAEPEAAPVGDNPAAATDHDDPCPASLAETRRPYCQDRLTDGSFGPPLVVLPPGEFRMGSSVSADESPQHRVSIRHSLAMSRFEVSVGEYARFCAASGLACSQANAGNEALPVVQVSWDDAVQFTEWLSAETDAIYRLPSEAEWEYAARAGTESPYFFGNEITPSNAHSIENGDVSSPLPRNDRRINRNPFRLTHMSGNVREWVQDSWSENYDDVPSDGSSRMDADQNRRVVRGGSYADPAVKLRSAARESLDRGAKDRFTGFRVVRQVLE